jgi:serine/threonine protein kinase
MSITQAQVQREALNRQGNLIRWGQRRYVIYGGPQRAEFESGGEGLVQLAIELSSQSKYRIKCFWKPDAMRRHRSELLVKEKLSDAGKTVADALAGAPFGILDDLGPSTPFAVIMKNVNGLNWAALRERGSIDSSYPPADWPSIDIRATWAYGLATAVLRMENSGFVHADLSPGNVMVTAHGEMAGDMALVDFDSFVHPADPTLDRSCHGTPGFAAPEIWDCKTVRRGSDRLGMAILIQEFLVVGDPSITRDEAFGWAYDQDTEILNRAGKPHPLIRKKYPYLADLVRAAIASPVIENRPSPDDWRTALRQIVLDARYGPRLKNAVWIPDGPSRDHIAVDVYPNTSIDLRTSPFAIRVQVACDSEGRINCTVHHGADVRVQFAGNSQWRRMLPSEAITGRPGMILFDNQGNVTARLEATEV